MSKHNPSGASREAPGAHFGGRPFVRTPYNYDRAAASKAAVFVNVGPSLTKAEQAEEADINSIVRKFGLGKPIPYSRTIPTYDDFSGIGDYQQAIGLLAEAQAAFAALPASVRDKLGNDPSKLVAIASRADAKDKLLELGLLQAVPTPPPAGETAK